MLIVESVLGNMYEPVWQPRLSGANVEWLTLDQWEAQKHRLRTQTSAGTEIAISLDRGTVLQDGDVLLWDASARTAIVARIHLNEVMVIQIAQDAPNQEWPTLVRTCVELGHALGNQHWPAVVKGSRIYVPLAVDKDVMASVLNTHAIPGITYQFIAGAEVIPYLAPNEQRRLFGNLDQPVHSHVHQHEPDKAVRANPCTNPCL
jgi:urease accessory protein